MDKTKEVMDMKIEPTGIWKISPGEEGKGWDDCLKNGTIGIGYAYDDLHGYTEEEVIEYKRKTDSPSPGYLETPLHFFFHIKEGHIIVAYSAPSTIYGIGIVTENEWEYNPEVTGDTYWLKNTRKVDWFDLRLKIDDGKIKSELGSRNVIIPIEKLFFEKKLLPLFPKDFANKLKDYNQYGLISEDQFRKKVAIKEKQASEISDEELRNKIKSVHRKIGIIYIISKQYDRDPYIAELAKRRAKGICQLCNITAPFNNKNGNPYLEVHHIQWLSKEGEDSIDNTVALCPNCHRKTHILNLEDERNYLLRKASGSI